MSVMMEVWGDYACFTRPEMKTERVSYDVMTPSAARGILESIYWHPGIFWVIDRIYVLNEIKFTNIKRNEVKSKILASTVRAVMTGGKNELFVSTSADIQQRAAMVLKDVHYIIEAHFDINDAKAAPSDNCGKFSDIIRRRLEKGQCYSQPYFGCREFPVSFKKWEGGEIKTAYDKDIDLSFMLYDMDYSDSENITPMFFRAALEKGVLDLTKCEVFK